ncbi:MAG TPA: alpha/beta hydrolase [Candidatus Acidoferrales bacterium]|nr:alpha/beta hydrolase [Candidatus Acidoferrales bacterium]
MTSPSFGERILRFLILTVAGYVLALILIRVFESRFIFFPNYPDRLAGNWAPRGLLNQDVWISSSDGTKLHAWWIPNENAVYTFLAFHGNAGNISDRAEVYKFLRDVPANVLAMEYRGYGKSEGVPSESGIYLDAEATLDYLVTSKHISPGTIIAYGQSLGTAVAAHLAARQGVAGVVLEAPFPSAAAVARQKLWFFPGLSLLFLKQFDTERALRNVRAPILIIHCTQDPVIPFQLGKIVFEKAQEPKSFIPIDGYCHEEASMIAPALYQARIRTFLSEVGGRPTQ